jgi:hypothetical protein
VPGLHQTLLERAAVIAGGYVRLSACLGVSDARLDLWRQARARIPDPVFLMLVDLVLQDDLSRAADDRRRRPRARVRSIAADPPLPSSNRIV